MAESGKALTVVVLMMVAMAIGGIRGVGGSREETDLRYIADRTRFFFSFPVWSSALSDIRDNDGLCCWFYGDKEGIYESSESSLAFVDNSSRVGRFENGSGGASGLRMIIRGSYRIMSIHVALSPFSGSYRGLY